MDVVGAIKQIEGRIEGPLEELYRLICMKYVLRPAAYVLPKRSALSLANILSLLLLAFPRRGYSTYLMMRRCFKSNGQTAFELAHKWLAQPFRDLVMLRRVLNGVENPNDWKIIEKNAESSRSIRESGESFIIATGHFAREAMLTFYLGKINRNRIIHVSNPVRLENNSLLDRRLQIQLGTSLETARYCRPEDLEMAAVGTTPFALRKLHDGLRKPGHVVLIHIDAPWEDGAPRSLNRPFAAYTNRCFATGAARLARLTQRPIITCVPVRGDDGTVVLEWGTPIFPSSIPGKASDIVVMDKLLGELELSIGANPTQYILPLGMDRQWDPSAQRWKSLDENGRKDKLLADET